MSIRYKAFSSAFGILQKTGLSRLLAPMTQGCGAVFMLHHVRPERDGAFQPNRHLEITPEFLRLTVERIRANGYEILALDEAVDLLKSGYGRKRYAVLTFDDGYKDNLDVAYPVLKEMQAPFTVFVASGLIDRTTELWWEALELMIGSQDEIVFSEDGAREGISCRTADEKCRCFNKLTDYLTLEASEQEQRAIIRALADRYGVDLQDLADREMMTWDEVRQLASDPLVTIGAHTHDHFALARLDPDLARADIDKGLQRLEDELGQRPKHFAYPYGKPNAVNEGAAEIARAIGFASAVTTFPGILQSANTRDLMLLPRVSVNGCYQDPAIIDQYLTGAPFALYKAASWLSSGFGLRDRAKART
ncbi:polysaccharide deacetylase family protein [Roseibium sp.]|uniref:polysaccharide deacetylase family protein n=1 Tax=Roseibium sp. TaxID=1936156 RepID=UPI003B52D58A